MAILYICHAVYVTSYGNDNSHFLSEHQIEDKANDSKHNAHSWEYTVGDEELHCHSLMLMSPRSASCVHNVQELKSQKNMICTWEHLQWKASIVL